MMNIDLELIILNKMKKKILLFLIVFSIFGYSQNKKLFFCAEFKNSWQKKFVEDNEIANLNIIYQSEIAPNEVLDEKILIEALNRKFPDKNKKDYGIINWEGTTEIDLNRQEDPAKFKISLNKFVNALKTIKKLRPNVKWSIYGFPTCEFWTPGYFWEKRNYNLAEIYKNVDFLAPSLYLFYPEEELKSTFTENYIQRNVKLALKIGKKYNKEVYPFIWHRFHPSNQKYGMQTIPLDYFREKYIKLILTQKYQGKTVKGLIWWQADGYYSKNTDSYVKLKEEYKNVTNIELHNVNLFQSYYDSIKNLVK